MVVIPKKNGKLCICLDPMDLNRALQRENYPMPTSPTGSGTLFLMRSLCFVLRLIHRLGDTAGKGCRSGSDLHLKCFSVKCMS